MFFIIRHTFHYLSLPPLTSHGWVSRAYSSSPPQRQSVLSWWPYPFESLKKCHCRTWTRNVWVGWASLSSTSVDQFSNLNVPWKEGVWRVLWGSPIGEEKQRWWSWIYPLLILTLLQGCETSLGQMGLLVGLSFYCVVFLSSAFFYLCLFICLINHPQPLRLVTNLLLRIYRIIRF